MANEFVARKGIISLGGLNFPYKGVASNYTASTDDHFIDFITGLSEVTATLPTVSGDQGKEYILRNSSSQYNLTVQGMSGRLVDGSVNILIGPLNTVKLVSNGTTNWKIEHVGGPVRNYTNNALLTSDGTIGGTNANYYLGFDGVTLSQTQQNTGSTYSLTYTENLFGITATTGYTEGQRILSIPRANIVSCTCDYEIIRPLGVSRRVGTISVFPTISATSSQDITNRTSGNICSALFHSSTTTNIIFYTRFNTCTTSAETLNVSIACRTVSKAELG